jgi:hypothetical protein
MTALLDRGSSTTILREEIARQLGAGLNFEDVTVTALHGTNTEKMASLKLQVSSDCKEWHDVNQAKTSTKFVFGDTQLQWSDYVKQDPVFKGVDVGDYNYNDIDLLVGRNVKRRPTEDCSNDSTLQLQRHDSQRKHYRLEQRRRGVHRCRTTPSQRRQRPGHQAKKDRNEPKRSAQAGGSRQVNVLEGGTHQSANAVERQICIRPAQRSSSEKASTVAAQEVGGVGQDDHG